MEVLVIMSQTGPSLCNRIVSRKQPMQFLRQIRSHLLLQVSYAIIIQMMLMTSLAGEFISNGLQKCVYVCI